MRPYGSGVVQRLSKFVSKTVANVCIKNLREAVGDADIVEGGGKCSGWCGRTNQPSASSSISRIALHQLPLSFTPNLSLPTFITFAKWVFAVVVVTRLRFSASLNGADMFMGDKSTRTAPLQRLTLPPARPSARIHFTDSIQMGIIHRANVNLMTLEKNLWMSLCRALRYRDANNIEFKSERDWSVGVLAAAGVWVNAVMGTLLSANPTNTTKHRAGQTKH